ncbi:MAG: NADH-quinone oxidoreductase subunit NuoK [Alphaproteobacteria bacterium]|jgi:NADH-quinone oxidoreductase subunit K|nr:NADH-quinone oxidoreductase subunit NuoK [Alphaproteobacteria bacterium]MBT5828324.1 NADH-quinone oxidoreductase subunit NuoK [Alphaproteobacteria bacterium]
MELLTYQDIPINYYIIVSISIFVIGIIGMLLNRKTIINFLMSLELVLLAANINFVAFSAHIGDLLGQIFVMFILTVAAAEVAIGIAILIVYFREKGNIDAEEINLLKG